MHANGRCECKSTSEHTGYRRKEKKKRSLYDNKLRREGLALAPLGARGCSVGRSGGFADELGSRFIDMPSRETWGGAAYGAREGFSTCAKGCSRPRGGGPPLAKCGGGWWVVW